MRTALILAALAALLPAQSLVIPAGKSLDTTEANSNLLTPGNPSVARLQMFYANSVLGGAARSVGGIRLRPDGASSSYRPWGPVAAKNVEVFAGNHPGPANMDRFSHAANQPLDYTKVLLATTVNFPGPLPLPAATPEPFMVDIKLDKPFAFTNKAGLLIEMTRDDLEYKYYRYYFDAFNDSANNQTPEGAVAAVGKGCPTDFLVSGHRVIVSGTTKVGTAAPYPGATFITQGEAQKAQIPLIGILGISDAAYLGLPLPLDLKPFGAPECALYNDWALTQVGVSGASAAGEFLFRWGKVPHDPLFAGLVLFHQAVGVDLGFNALNLRVSQGLKLTLGKGFKPALETGAVYGNGFSSFPNYALTEDEPQYWASKAIVLELY